MKHRSINEAAWLILDIVFVKENQWQLTISCWCEVHSRRINTASQTICVTFLDDLKITKKLFSNAFSRWSLEIFAKYSFITVHINSSSQFIWIKISHLISAYMESKIVKTRLKRFSFTDTLMEIRLDPLCQQTSSLDLKIWHICKSSGSSNHRLVRSIIMNVCLTI